MCDCWSDTLLPKKACMPKVAIAYMVLLFLKMGLMGSLSSSLSGQGSTILSHLLLLLFRKLIVMPVASKRPAYSNETSGKRMSVAYRNTTPDAVPCRDMHDNKNSEDSTH